MDGVDLHDVAKEHKRTFGAIKSRVMKNALNMMKDGNLQIEDVANMVNIPVEELENKKTRNERVRDPVQNQDLMSILVEIRDYLKIIAEK